MSAFLTATAFLVLVAVAAYVIHRLGLQHAARIAAYRYSTPRPGRRGRCAPQPYAAPRVRIPAGPARPATPPPSARSAATRARGVHADPGPREERPGPWTEASEDLEHLST
ncbi:hypothetical protein ACIG63_05985 [Streptomyces antimycoticus]|uniref:Secreted protein n=2 Tax=Streptomyces violaceusniger group TaxID=2839105 RepID=A0ABD5JKW4_9ACTN|nr:hypothetical protein [Streptomyces violaceusniger]MEE4588396.1 hypothetical protein [Streptomyces sp. DSM 41602]